MISLALICLISTQTTLAPRSSRPKIQNSIPPEFVAARQAPSGDSNLTSIRLKLESGNVTRYKETSTNKIEVTMPGNMGNRNVEISNSSLVTFITGGVGTPGSYANLTIRVSDQKTAASGQMFGNPMDLSGKETHIQGYLTSQFLIEANEAGSAAFSASLSTAPNDYLFFIPYPHEKVKIGSKWEILSSLRVKGQGTVKDIREQNHKKYWILDYTMTLPIHVSSKEMAQMVKKIGSTSIAMNMSLSGTFDLHCEEWVNISTGAVKTLTYTGNLNSKLNFSDYNMSALESGVIEGKLENTNPNA